MEFGYLIGGALLGVLFQYIYDKASVSVSSYRIKKEMQQRRELLTGPKTYEWIFNYHKKQQNLDDLYDCKIGEFEIKIPFMSKKEWQFIQNIEMTGNTLLDRAKSDTNTFQIDNKLIEARKAQGQNLFNEPILYLDRISEDNMVNPLKLHVKTCQYYEIATNLIKLEEELIHAIRNPNIKTPLRDQHFSSISKVAKVSMRPFALGVISVLAIKTKTPKSYEIAFHTRSHSTATQGGTKAITPAFGLIPVFGDTSKEQINILYYNFIKEYLEELYSYNELDKINNNKRVNPKWFFEWPEAKQILESNIFSLEFLGFGFNLVNGAPNVVLLARVDDVDIGEEIKRNINANWETGEQKIGEAPLEFVRYDADKLSTWLEERLYPSASAFAVAKTQEYISRLIHSEKTS